jgi:MazG family protein
MSEDSLTAEAFSLSSSSGLRCSRNEERKRGGPCRFAAPSFSAPGRRLGAGLRVDITPFLSLVSSARRREVKPSQRPVVAAHPAHCLPRARGRKQNALHESSPAPSGGNSAGCRNRRRGAGVRAREVFVRKRILRLESGHPSGFDTGGSSSSDFGPLHFSVPALGLLVESQPVNEKIEAMKKLQEVVETLRGPRGCPWDRVQTLDDMGRHLLEEVCEVADALEEGRGRPTPQVREELGDVLMNVLLAARIAEEAGAFSIAEVAETIRDKLIRRHPHVFGDIKASGAADALRRWNEVKQSEQEAPQGPRSLLDRVPRSLPPLARAYDVSEKAARAGFDWPDVEGPLEKLDEEIREVRALLLELPGARAAGPQSPIQPRARERLEEELGDVFFSAVNVCRKLGVHPDAAVKASLRKFAGRFREMERQLGSLEESSLEEMQRIWERLRKEDRA